MPVLTWRTDDPEFPQRLAELRRKLSIDEGLTAAGAADEPPLEVVRRIINDVRSRGDAAVLELTARLDGCELTAEELRVSPEQIARAREECSEELLAALELSAGRVRRFQEAILRPEPQPVRADGRLLRTRYRPVDSAGLCIPGGVASLASTVIMAAVPARAAGVPRVVMATPPRSDGSVSADRLLAADLAGVDEVYRVGGAQGVAALAYGTETIAPVDFIAGPGNIYTTLAKKEVFGQVGIEMLPGPSEVVIIADADADPRCVAADLIAQAEHNPGSAVLVTDDEALAGGVAEEVETQLARLPRGEAARRCLEEYGALIVADSLEECAELANQLAPEHLQIIAERAEDLAAEIRHAGAVFLGPWAPVAVGDYVAGPSHVLPTSGTARFSGGLSANDFLKSSTLISYEPSALADDADAVARLARAEGLEGHARSVRIRGAEAEDTTSPE